MTSQNKKQHKSISNAKIAEFYSEYWREDAAYVAVLTAVF